MSLRDNESNLSQQTAAFLSNGGLAIARKLQALNTKAELSKVIEVTAIEHLKPQAIGPWQVEQQGDVYRYVRQASDESLWWESTRETIEPKRDGVVRVCVLGESAAAGMFYTPHYSPAIALQKYLQQNGKQDFEVVDLTRNSLGFEQLNQVMADVWALKPDYVVIYAGNNWFGGLEITADSDLDGRAYYGLEMEKANLQGAVDSYRRQMNKRAEVFVDHLQALSKRDGFTPLVIMPASNMTDWERVSPLPWLENMKTASWYNNYNQACTELENGQFHQARAIAKSMLKSDGGLFPTSNRLMAKALIGLGREEQALDYIEKELFLTNCFDNITPIPGMPAYVKKTMKKLAQQYDIHCVDQYDLLSQGSGKVLLDEEVFVDYCHLTAKGMDYTMAPVANNLINLNNGVDCTDGADKIEVLHSNEVGSFPTAVAKFYAGIYHMHLNRSATGLVNPQIQTQLVEQAVAVDERILHAISLYVKANFANNKGAFSLSAAGQELFGFVNSPLDFALASFVNCVDAQTVSALCEILQQYGQNGAELLQAYQAQYAEQLKQPKGVDLTHPIYIEQVASVLPLQNDTELSSRRAMPFYSAKWPISNFTCVSDAQADLTVNMTARLAANQHYGEEQKFVVLVNGKQVASKAVVSKWQSNQFVISKDLLKSGFNRVSVIWPELPNCEQSVLQQQILRYQSGITANFFPVFGELFELSIKQA